VEPKEKKMWFFKKKSKEMDNYSRSNLWSEIEELYAENRKLNSKIGALEIDMRFLQEKMKNKIFKKPTEEETTETNKKPSVFLNPYGNPI
jgi:hypothetical protein